MTDLTSKIQVGGVDVDEAEFLDRLRSSDASAVRLLIRQLQNDRRTSGSAGLALISRAYSTKLTTFLRRLFRALDDPSSHAEEALNDTLVRVFSRFDQYDPERAKFRTWVFQQARYAGLDILRSASRLVGAELPDAAAEYEVMPLAERERRALRRAFRALTATQQRLLLLRYVEEYMPSEMSRLSLIEDIPESHIKVYINRAAAMLERLYLAELEQAT